MNETPLQDSPHPPKRQYKWPWFVLAALLLAIALAIVWMSFEIKRTKRNRDLMTPRSGL